MRAKNPLRVAVFLAFLLCRPAGAADIPLTAPDGAPATPPAPRAAAAPWSWAGFYVGGHLGALSGTTTFSDPTGQPLYGGTVASNGLLAGLQLGYNWQVAPQWVVGLEADASMLSSTGGNTCLQSSVTLIGSNCKITPREIATLTGRLGFVLEPRGRTLLYGKAGVAWMHADTSMNPNNTVNSLDEGFAKDGYTFDGVPIQGDPTSGGISAFGAALGAGFEYALTPAWSLKMEYNYLRFSGMSLATPQTSNVTVNGDVTNLPSSGLSNITQSFHIAKIGLNYRFGADSRTSEHDEPAVSSGTEAAAVPWTANWEIDMGARYWYSSGTFQTANGTAPNVLLSRLTYSGMVGNSGEIFARIDSPVDLFVKGFVGTGGVGSGTMHDEDWGPASTLAAAPTAYEVTKSNVSGTLQYLTADIGYNVMRGPDHKVGVFMGYNRYQTTMNAMGCAQLVQPSSGICSPNIPTSTNIISEIDTWQSLRLGVSAEAQVWDRFKISGDLAFLPYVAFSGLDIHRMRTPIAYFPVQGGGNGVQAEVILSYRVTDSFSLGVGGRYWAMWTTAAYQSDNPANGFNVSAERYGMFLQASYKFMPPR